MFAAGANALPHQDPVAYCSDLFPDSYSLRLACIEQEREARDVLSRAGDLATGQREGAGTATAVAAVRKADLARFDDAAIVQWDGEDWGVETYAEARSRLPDEQLMRCVYHDQNDNTTRQCVVMHGMHTVATFYIRAATP